MNKQLVEIVNGNDMHTLHKINDVLQNIFRLKNENRSIGQRINHLHQKRYEYIKVIKNNKGNKNILREYDKKIDSNINLQVLLTKLQKHNSKLILRHRNKIQQLRKELV